MRTTVQSYCYSLFERIKIPQSIFSYTLVIKKFWWKKKMNGRSKCTYSYKDVTILRIVNNKQQEVEETGEEENEYFP